MTADQVLADYDLDTIGMSGALTLSKSESFREQANTFVVLRAALEARRHRMNCGLALQNEKGKTNGKACAEHSGGVS